MSTRTKTIVAGVRDVGADDLAMRVALQLGRRSGAAVHLVHAFQVQPPVDLAHGAEMEDAAAWAGLPGELEQALERAAGPFRGGRPPACHAVAGSAWRVLRGVVEEHRADLVVVGAPRPGRLRQAFASTTPQRLLRAVHVPVLVARVPLPAGPPRVLFTTDLSPASEEVHDLGLRTASAFLGPRFDALRTMVVAAFGFSLPPIPAPSQARGWMLELERFVAARQPPPEHMELLVRTGTETAAEILAEAEAWRADVLVVGSHVRKGIDRVLLGSTAEACIRDAACSVLVVPPGPVPAEGAPAARAAPDGAFAERG